MSPKPFEVSIYCIFVPIGDFLLPLNDNNDSVAYYYLGNIIKSARRVKDDTFGDQARKA